MKMRSCVVPLVLTLAATASPALATIPWTVASSNSSLGWTPAVRNRVVFDGFTNYIDVFTVSKDTSRNMLYTQIYVSLAAPDGLTLGTVNLGGYFLDAPSTIGWGTTSAVFGVQGDKRIYVNWSDDLGPWTGWSPLAAGMPSGGFCSAPSAASWKPGRVDVFAIACTTHALWHIWTNDGYNWASWESLGGDYAQGWGAPPAAGACNEGSLSVFVTDRTTNHLMDRHYDAGWTLTDSFQRAEKTISMGCDPHSVAFGRNGTTEYFADIDGPPWLGSVSISPIAGLPLVHPVRVAQTVPRQVVYYRTILGRISRRGFHANTNADPGSWDSLSTDLAPDTFDGEPNGVESDHNVPGLFVFATKSNGSLWFAHDTAQ